MNTLRTLVRSAALRLQQAGVDSPQLSAEVLLAHCLGIARPELQKNMLMNPQATAAEEQAACFQQLMQRREQGEPVAYLLGVREFLGRDFRVTPDTLIPRPETELLVEKALEAVQGGTGVFADFGTGSGCIAVSLALALPGWQGVALDLSLGALQVAQHNAEALGASALQFVQANFLHPPLCQESLELLVSNPPYVSQRDYEGISAEVRDFEPYNALVPRLHEKDGCGKNSLPSAHGLEDIEGIITVAWRLLKPKGRVFFEIGYDQGAKVLALLKQNDWQSIQLYQDLAGLDRVVSAVRP